MQAFLSTPTADPAGYIVLDLLATSKLGDTTRRVTRVATMDGGAVFNDFGYTEADRVLDLVWEPINLEIEEGVDRLVQTYARLHVSTQQGVFLAAPESYTPTPKESRLRLLVESKLSV